MCVSVCLCVCVRACVRASVSVCVCVCVCVCDDGSTVRSDERTLKAIYEKAIQNLLELIN